MQQDRVDSSSLELTLEHDKLNRNHLVLDFLVELVLKVPVLVDWRTKNDKLIAVG